eukprot:scaffold30494_cov31-Tisochrysis_lutea.AAC.5
MQPSALLPCGNHSHSLDLSSLPEAAISHKICLARAEPPYALNACEADSRLPEPLAEAVTRVQAAGGTRAVSDMLESVRGKTADLDACAMSIDALLEVEEGADQQLHLQHGERWACVRSAALTADARRELAEVSHPSPSGGNDPARVLSPH